MRIRALWLILPLCFLPFLLLRRTSADVPAVPNIIVIMTDDQRWDSLCWNGSGLTDICSRPTSEHPMPFIEGLMSDSVVFSNAFVSDPLCCPTRASFLSGGFYAQHTNVLHNVLPNGGMGRYFDTVSLGTLLQQQGYHTALMGKYLNRYEDFVDETTHEGYVPPGWSQFVTTYNWAHVDWMAYDVVRGSTSYTEPGIGAHSRERGEYETDFLSQNALQFLDATCSYQSCSAPFFLLLTPFAPHIPAPPASRHATLFSDFVYNERGYVEQPDGDLSDKPIQIQDMANDWDPVSEEESQRNQLRSLRAVDEMVQALYDNLEQKGLLSQTVIIFWSDNGVQWGEHKLTKKQKPYEESVRVPFFIHQPGTPARTEDKLVSADIDLPPTILELGGVTGWTSNGVSLAPLLDNPDTPWRHTLFLQGLDSGVSSLYTWAGVRTATYKYVELGTGESELYDLVNDPYELDSKHADPAYASIKADLAAQLVALGRGIAITTANWPIPALMGLPHALIQTLYHFTLTAWGGDGHYTWDAYHDTGDCAYNSPPGVTLSAEGILSGTPTQSGTFLFCVRVEDTSLSPQPGNPRPQNYVARLQLVVQATNRPPLAVADSYTTDEDTPLVVNAPGVLGNDTNADHDLLRAALVVAPTHGALTFNSNGSFSYTPAANYAGPDSFTYQADDWLAYSNVATVTITVNPVNDAPAATGDSYLTDKNTALVVQTPGVLGNDADADGDSLAATLVLSPTHGGLTLNPDGSFTYLPDGDYSDPDSFTYVANDGQADSNMATATIKVNAAPVAAADSYTTDEDTGLMVAAPGVLENDSDANNDLLTAWLAQDVAAGALTLRNTGAFTYTPPLDYHGVISFTYQAHDGRHPSNVAAVTIAVNPLNDAPAAVADSYTTDKDTMLVAPAPGVLGNDTDPDNDLLTAFLIHDVTTGTLTLSSAGAFTYTPPVNYNGAVSFTYQVNDGQTDSNVAMVAIAISPPTATIDSYVTEEDAPLVVDAPGVLANDTDPENGPLTAFLIQNVTTGTLTFSNTGAFTYTPPVDYNGVVSFTYQAHNGEVPSNIAAVTITVNPVNDVPAAVSEIYTIDEDTPLVVFAPGVLGNDSDPDNDLLAAFIIQDTPVGTLALSRTGAFTYTPSINYNGVVSFTYQANDGQMSSDIAQVMLTVSAVNDAPVAGDDNYRINEDDTLVVTAADGLLANDSDVDDNPLVITLVAAPVHGVLTLNSNGAFSYTPTANYAGPDSFTYQANDWLASSNVATVTITVNPVNDAPTATGDSYLTDKNTALVVQTPGVLGNDADADGDSLIATLVLSPTHGALTLNPDGSFAYLPDGDYSGLDSFIYVANDGQADSNMATVAIKVNTAPVAAADSYTTDEDTGLVVASPGVLGNDSDGDGDLLTAALVAAPAHGTLTLHADGSFSYTPAANYVGPDSFTYQTDDGGTLSTVVGVVITVNPVNDPPMALGDAYTYVKEGLMAVAAPGVLGNDSDVEDDPLTTSLVAGPAHGTLTLNPDGSFRYMPAAGYIGPDSFSYQVHDAQTVSNAATVSLVVSAGPTTLYLSSNTGGTAGGVAFADEDVLAYHLTTGLWSMLFDGSDVGLASADVDAFSVQSDGSLLLSLDIPLVVGNLGTVDASDILRFIPADLGTTTAGSFELFWDGSAYGLTDDEEDVDALALAPDGRLLVSTTGKLTVAGVMAQDEDLSALNLSTGSWSLYFDGSDVGLAETSNEDVFGAAVNGVTGDIYLTTLGLFNVPGTSGDGGDVLLCRPGSMGNKTSCAYSLFWDGSARGFDGEVLDALELGFAATPVIWASPSTTQIVSGLTFADEDIFFYDPTLGVFGMAFDGSDIGLTKNVDAFSRLDDGSLLLSLVAPADVAGLGTVDDSDILRFIPTALGLTTAGTLELYFDGSTDGLTDDGEDIDALALAPDGRLLVSTTGIMNVTGLTAQDEDLSALDLATGDWSLYFDGSDVGLSQAAGEDVVGVWVSDDASRVYLTTLGVFDVPGVSGDGADVLLCSVQSLGNTTACAYSLFWDGSAHGVTAVLDGLEHIQP